MQIAITGGNGRIGRAVTALALAQGHRVVSIDIVSAPSTEVNPNYSYIQANITHYDEIERALQGCEGLVHLAAIPAPGELPDHVVYNTNTTGSYNTLRAAVEHGIAKICQASSVNAIGGPFSRWPRYDYFPLDERHPTYNEDPYSLSKWVCEQQADSLARRYEDLTIASLRFHYVVESRAALAEYVESPSDPLWVKNLWGYTTYGAAARACLAALTADFKNHEVFYITGPITVLEQPSLPLAQEFFPNVPITGNLSGNRSFFDCAKAERMLGWRHD